MRTPGLHTLRRFFVGLGLVLVCGVGGLGYAGDQVTFTDADASAPRLEKSKKTTPQDQGKRRWESFLDRLSGPTRGGSLEAVTPPPFAPAVPGTETVVPLTEKEWQRLKERQNWIHRRPEDLGKTDRDTPGLLGVRGENQVGQPEPSTTAPKPRQGWLTEYYEQLSKNRSGAETAIPEPLRNSPESARDRRRQLNPLPEVSAWEGASPQRGESLRPVEAAGFGRGDTPAWERSALATQRPGETDMTAEQMAREPLWLRNRGSLERSRYSLSPQVGPAPALPGTPALEGVARIMGQNPIGNPLAAAPLAANPLSSLDPVTAYPDPTRELLNPVTPVKSGQGADPKAVGPGLNSAETTPARNRMLSASPGPLSSVAPAGAGADVRLPATPTPDERRALHSIKLNLELPRRSF